jgi:RNA polymerase sigma-70 factor, ECF subfamily
MLTAEALYDDHWNFVMSVLVRKCGNQDAAEEMAQETMFRAVRALHQGIEVKNARSWLATIATRIFIDWLRWCKRYENPVSLEWVAEREDGNTGFATDHLRYLSSPADQVEYIAEHKERLEEIPFHQLTELQERVFHLHMVVGYSTLEVAEMMNVSEGSIKAIKHRTMLKLRAPNLAARHLHPHPRRTQIAHPE